MAAKKVTESRKKSGDNKKRVKAPAKLSRLKKPIDMSLEEWQLGLRREFGQAQEFAFKRVGSDDSIFSEYLVRNPQTGREYRVAIRGREPGANYCACRDFSVNTLGTCKHIEFLLSRLEKRRGGKTALAKGFTPAYSEIFLHYGMERKVIFRRGTDIPTELTRLASQYFSENGELRLESFGRFEEFLKEAGRFEHELRVYDDALNFIARMRDDAHRLRAVEAAFPQGEKSKAFNKLLRVPLYPYQCVGALFAARAGRCLLADDMGLGKTIQSIAAAEILASLAGVERVLVVCPTSLKHQWKQEIEKFTRRSAEVVEGYLPARTALYQTESFYKITNYDVIHSDREMIRSWRPDLIILDEAQRIKNWKTRTAQSVKALESDYAIVLTGTPLENRLEELHSIVEFVDRFRLGPAFRFLHEHQQVDEDGRVVGYRHLSRISETLKTILLRRTKNEVLKDLPERLEKNFFVPMTNQQMAHHDEHQTTVSRITAKWRRMGFLTEKDQRFLMIALQNMRMVCDSTYLLDQATDFGVKTEEFMRLLDEMLEDPDSKIVVFSQWTRMHELLIKRLEKKKLDHAFFHGGVPGPKRKDLVQRFKEDPACRLFLATDAGGVGLNLQHANTVINMDIPWNPAILEQRIGRVHRLGQSRPVRVVNFISQGAIEEGMLQLLDFKKSLFTGVLDGKQDEVFLNGSRLKRFMQTVENAVNNIPVSMPVATPDDWTDAAVVAQQPELAEAQPEPEVVAPRQSVEWRGLIDTGLTFLQKLGETMRALETPQPTKPVGSHEPRAAVAASSVFDQLGALGRLVEVEPTTGRPCLKLPMPNADLIQRTVDLLKAWTDTK